MIVLDTDILIDHLRGEHDAVAFLEERVRSGETLAATTVNAAELYQGAEGSQDRREALFSLSELLESIELLDLDREAALRYGQLMAELDAAGQPLSGMDGLIAAIALEHGAQLATRNARDFDRVRGLRLVTP